MDNGRSHIETNEGMHPFVMGRSFGLLVATILFCMLAFNLLKKKDKKRASIPSFISPTPIGEGNDHYDVFLSFRGSDTRKGFADHLYHSLDRVGIVPAFVFRDDKNIPIGEEFGPWILDAIAQSKISIPIISKNYASSKWCLRELIHIMDRVKSTSHIVLPIFYKVDPSDVRHLKGSFGKAFHSRKKYFDEEDIQKGQQALKEVSYLHGWESEKVANGHEGELIERVVETIIRKLQEDFQLDVPPQLVGLDGPMKEIMNRIPSPSINARMIGIYGMGGIGKTTLAKCIYNQLFNKFTHVSFLLDVRETIRKNGITYLQNQLISDILQSKWQVSRIDDGISIIKSRFRGKKVLVLLDDIDNKKQLDALAKKRDWFMAGSLIIVTTRNEAILDQSEFEVDYKYKLNELDMMCALLLFNKHAFRKDHSPRDFEGISHDIISTMGGLPLALQVVGSYLYNKNRKVWEDVKKKLKKQPHRDIQKILQISYDALEDGQKQIFLDIVCFFIGKTSKYAMYMWEDCGFYPGEGIEELKLRCLIKIGDYGQFIVHDQLRDLGRSIFCQGHSGPWDDNYEGVPRVLRNLKRRPWFHDFLGATSSGHSKFSEVRWLEWDVHGNDASLSTINLHLPKLSVLELWGSGITENWEGWNSFMASKQLKVLNVQLCYNLRCTPKLSAFTQLKILVLSNCDGLKRLHPSIGKLTSLVSLDLSYCRGLKELPEEVGGLKDLEELILNYSGITAIPSSIGSLSKLKTLSANSCKSLREIPSSIGDLQNLQYLNLKSIVIEKLPSAIGGLKNLQFLCLFCCTSLKGAIPSEIGDLPSLEGLTIDWTQISDLPESVRNLSSLQNLSLWGCKELRSLPALPSSLQNLNLWGCKELRSLPVLPSSLQSLDIRGCEKLRSLLELPSSLQSLDLSGCKELRSLPELPSSLQALQSLDLWDCKELRSLPKLPSSLQSLDLRGCKELGSLPELPSSLQSLDLSGCKELRSLPKLPSSLLELWACKELRSLPKLPSSLQSLDLRGCKELGSLPELPSSLQSLDLSGCKELRLLPELPSSLLKLWACKELRSLPKLPSSLQSLDLRGCYKLRSLPELPSSLQILDLRDCKELWSLPKLPSSLQCLNLKGCEELRSLPEFPSGLTRLWVTCQSLRLPQLFSLIRLEELSLDVLHLLEDIYELSSIPVKLFFEERDKLTSLCLDGPTYLEELSIEKCSSIKYLTLSRLFRLKIFRAEHCNSLVQICSHDDLVCLKVIFLYDCNSIRCLLCPRSRYLKKLVAVECDNLVEIQGLDGAEFLEELDFTGCKSMETLPDLTGCEKLRSLRVRDCKKLTQLQGLKKLNLIDLDISGCDSLEAILKLSGSNVFRNYEQELSFDSWSDAS